MRRLMMVMVLVCVLMMAGAEMVFAKTGDDPGIGTIPQPELSGSWLAGFIYVLHLILLKYVPWFRNWWDRFVFKRYTQNYLEDFSIITTFGNKKTD